MRGVLEEVRELGRVCGLAEGLRGQLKVLTLGELTALSAALSAVEDSLFRLAAELRQELVSRALLGMVSRRGEAVLPAAGEAGGGPQAA